MGTAHGASGATRPWAPRGQVRGGGTWTCVPPPRLCHGPCVSRTSHLADPRDVTEMGPYSSQVGCGVVPPLTPPKMSPCSELPRPTVSPPRWLLQFPTEDGAYGYGATLPPELFEDNAADGDGGETRAGGFVRGWGLCEGLPPPPHSSPADEPLSPLCRRSCPGSQRPLHRLPLPLPGGWGQPAPGHRPLHRHPGEVSAEGGGHPGGLRRPSLT